MPQCSTSKRPLVFPGPSSAKGRKSPLGGHGWTSSPERREAATISHSLPGLEWSKGVDLRHSPAVRLDSLHCTVMLRCNRPRSANRSCPVTPDQTVAARRMMELVTFCCSSARLRTPELTLRTKADSRRERHGFWSSSPLRGRWRACVLSMPWSPSDRRA